MKVAVVSIDVVTHGNN